MANLKYIHKNRLYEESLREGEEEKQQAIAEAKSVKVWLLWYIIIGGIGYFKAYHELSPMPLIITSVIMGIFLIALWAESLAPDESRVWYNSVKMAGAEGENVVLEMLEQLPDDYTIFNQVEIPCQDSKRGFVELDFIVVSHWGIYVLEVKHSHGTFTGDAEEKNLSRDKESNQGYIYSSTVPNPVKQLNWQIYQFNKFLRKHKVHVWIDGFVVFSHDEVTLNIQNNTNIIPKHRLIPTLAHLRQDSASNGNKKCSKAIPVQKVTRILAQLTPPKSNIIQT